MESSGALMVSGAWGSGKTYYINNTLIKELTSIGKLPILISLFGLSSIDGLERRITESFLLQYGEEKLVPAEEKDKGLKNLIVKRLSKLKLSKGTQGVQSIADFAPIISQYIDVSRVIDAYTNLCTPRLPIDKIVLIFDDLERSVKTIPPHLLLGAINNLVEIKKMKIVLIANDSYFNENAENYLDFKEKVIKRTLLFPHNIELVYGGLIKKYGASFDKLMSVPSYINIINPDSDVNKDSVELQENLCNIRILKFSIAHYDKIYEALSDTIESHQGNPNLSVFLLSLWALTVFLSIEYKCNRLTYLNRDEFIKATAVDTFFIDIGSKESNPFEPQVIEEDQIIEKKSDTIRSSIKEFFERHSLPLIPSIQVFDLITAGVTIEIGAINQLFEDYQKDVESQKENPAIELLNRFLMSIGSFTNEEFPGKLKELADFTEQAIFPNDVAYINAATFLQHYGPFIGKSLDEIKSIVKKGIDRHYAQLTGKLPVLAKSNLDVIAPEIPSISKWVVDYLRTKIDETIDKEESKDIEEVVHQFKNDLPSLAMRLMPSKDTNLTPEFSTFPILAKIPEDVIVEKMKQILPNEVMAIYSIIDSRFIQHRTSFPISEESVFLSRVMLGIGLRDNAVLTLASYLLEDYVIPKITKVIPALEYKQ